MKKLTTHEKKLIFDALDVSRENWRALARRFPTPVADKLYKKKEKDISELMIKLRKVMQ